MKELIEALQILFKYAPDLTYPFHCEHDILYVLIDPADVSDEDKKRLKELGFEDGNESEDEDGEAIDNSEYEGMFYSFRYGSA